MIYQILADSILAIHVLFVFFVIGGLLATVTGGVRDWAWVRNFRFRIIHLCGIGFVVVQGWLGRICPLTLLEMWLRKQAGDAQYTGTFAQHWLEELLYFQAPMWAFAIIYTLFGSLVLLSWLKFPPVKRQGAS